MLGCAVAQSCVMSMPGKNHAVIDVLKVRSEIEISELSLSKVLSLQHL